MKSYPALLLAILLMVSLPGLAAVEPAPAVDDDRFNRDSALRMSQAALDSTPADYAFVNSRGQPRQLADYRGKPLVISLIFTSCHHICPTITKHLAKTAAKAESALGHDTFNIVTVGFDSANDRPSTMASFAAQQGVDRDNWDFLSADQASIDALADELGFLFLPSSVGFDHLMQTTILDADGAVYRQIYGMDFDTPHLIEPLKELIFGEQSEQTLVQQVSNRIRLFCTVYDPVSDSYRFDYSIFVGLVTGLCIGALFVYLLIREWRFSNASRKGPA